MVRRGLDATAALWPALRMTHGWVRDLARILDNAAGHDGATVSALVRAHLDAMQAERATAAPLGAVAAHIAKVTASYGSGLFRCDDVPDLPRTNNELERCFGSVRYHERRVTGRRTIAGGAIVRGAVHLTTILAIREGWVLEMRLPDRAAWQELRRRLDYRRETRRAQRRFRHGPAGYLRRLEQQLTTEECAASGHRRAR